MARTPKAARTRSRESERHWNLLTPHALVLLCIARDPETRVREIAEAVGISERGAHQIVSDLVQAGYIRRSRVGRRNHYAIEEKTTLRHGIIRHRRVASIVALLGPEPPRLSAKASRNGSRNGMMKSSVSKTMKRRAA